MIDIMQIDIPYKIIQTTIRVNLAIKLHKCSYIDK